MKLTQGMSHRKVATTVGGVLPAFAMNPHEVVRCAFGTKKELELWPVFFSLTTNLDKEKVDRD